MKSIMPSGKRMKIFNQIMDGHSLDLLDYCVPLYEKEGKTYLTIVKKLKRSDSEATGLDVL